MIEDFSHPSHAHKDMHQLGELLSKAISSVYGQKTLDLIQSLRSTITVTHTNFEDLFTELEIRDQDEVVAVSRFFGVYLGLLTITQRVYKILAYEKEHTYALSIPALCDQILPQLQLVFCRYNFDTYYMDIIWSCFRNIFDVIYDYRRSSHEDFDEHTLKEIYDSLDNLIRYPPHIEQSTLQDAIVQLGFHLKKALFPAVGLLVEQVHPADLPKLPQLIKFATWIGGDYTDPQTDIQSFERAKDFYSTVILECYRDSLDIMLTDQYSNHSLIPARLDLLMSFLRDKNELTTNELVSFKKHLDETLIFIQASEPEHERCYSLLQQLRAQVEVFSTQGLEIEVVFDSTNLVKLMESLYQKICFRRLSRLFQDNPGAVLSLKNLLEPQAIFSIIRTLPHELVHIWSSLQSVVKAKRIILSNLSSLYDLVCIRGLLELIPGMNVYITPVLESTETIQNAQNILSNYVALCRENNLSIKVNQLMMGYAFSAKEDGFFAAQAIIYDVQHQLTEWSQTEKIPLSFFQARGGSIARGGFPTTQLIASSQLTKENTQLKLTIEGEVINQRFGSPQSAAMTIKRYLGQIKDSVLNKIQDDFTEFSISLRKELVDRSKKEFVYYTQEERDFYDYYRSVTPFDFVFSSCNQDEKMDKRRLESLAWYVCWSQNRFFLPLWLGFGAVCQHLEGYSSTELKKIFADKFLYAVFMVLVFSLEKIDKIIVETYERELVSPHLKELGAALEVVYRQVLDFARKNLDFYQENSYFRYFVQDAHYRASYMVPLHLIQIEMLRRHRSQRDQDYKRELMFMESVLLISVGLQNSG